MAPVSMRRLGEQVVGEFSLLAEAKQIDLGLETSAALGATDAYIALTDQHALFLLLSTLIDNAIRYTPVGGTVDVLLERIGERIGIEVRDTGPGIPDDELNRVFDRFYRGTGTQVQGSGLGLAIAARIATRLGIVLILRNRAGASGLSARVDGFRPVAETRVAQT
jgi:two-component system OmpR family sensor kinase